MVLDDRTNTVMFRIEHWNPGHTTFNVFVGYNVGARGNCGKLTLRTDEFDELMQTVFNAVEITCRHPYMARLLPRYADPLEAQWVCRCCKATDLLPTDFELGPDKEVRH